MSAAGELLFGAARRKIFISFHHGGDLYFYEAFSNVFHDRYQVVYDNSLERKVDSENSEYVIRSIRERCISGSSCTIVLVGQNTWGRKFVDWEIDATLQKEHGLIGIRLPTLSPDNFGKYLVPDRLHENIVSGYALWLEWSQIAANPGSLATSIEFANSRPKGLIRNSATRRLRNA